MVRPKRATRVEASLGVATGVGVEVGADVGADVGPAVGVEVGAEDGVESIGVGAPGSEGPEGALTTITPSMAMWR
jgi:hypothetical protein